MNANWENAPRHNFRGTNSNLNDKMQIPFIKMHGLGNDYVYIDCFLAETAELLAKIDLPELARCVSDRHTGIGADGLVLIVPSMVADARMRMFNADGSEAQMCGNAIRCVGKYLYESGLKAQTHLVIETLAGNRTLELQVKSGVVEQVTVDMSQPRIAQDQLTMDGKTMPFVSVNMGNPHAIFFCDTMPDTNEVATIGKQIEKNPHFPEGTNVEFVCIRNEKEVDMRVWERGTGETLACGTGTCATVVAAILNGLVDADKKITVHLVGGDLEIEWSGREEDSVFMTGPATTVFTGEIDL